MVVVKLLGAVDVVVQSSRLKPLKSWYPASGDPPDERIFSVKSTVNVENKSTAVYIAQLAMFKLSPEDVQAMEQQLKVCIEEDRKYWRVNDVKCDAIQTAKSYEEFADRVAAAHLRPLEKHDHKPQPRAWNKCVTKERDVE